MTPCPCTANQKILKTYIILIYIKLRYVGDNVTILLLNMSTCHCDGYLFSWNFMGFFKSFELLTYFVQGNAFNFSFFSHI